MVKDVAVKTLTALILVMISLSLFAIGGTFMRNVMNDLHTYCKTCTIFDKNCPYSDQELLDEEYGNNPYCNDMGIYEMKFKIGGIFFYGIGSMSLVMAFLILREMRKNSKKVYRRKLIKKKK